MVKLGAITSQKQEPRVLLGSLRTSFIEHHIEKLLEQDYPAVGTTFRGLTLEAVIGEGCRGIVYRAVDSSGNRFAVKLSDKDSNESSYLGRIDHPKIIRLID